MNIVRKLVPVAARRRAAVVAVGATAALVVAAPSAMAYGVTASTTATHTGPGQRMLVHVTAQRVGNLIEVECDAEGSGSIFTEISCDGLKGGNNGTATAITYVKGWGGNDDSLRVCYTARALFGPSNTWVTGYGCTQVRL